MKCRGYPHAALRSADAIQLACAAHFGVDLLISNGRHLRQRDIPGVWFITLLKKAPVKRRA